MSLASAVRRIPLQRAFLFSSAVLLTTALAGCTDTVFRDRPPFNQPPDAASGFLGYYDATAKQTTCGNCHAGFQGGWVTTAHASAFAAASSSSGNTPACFSCHSLTGLGNQLSGTTAGHDAVQTAVYQDVQCESCHGPGLQHVEGVGQGTLIRPLARLGMSGTGNCGDCHSGGHHSLADEWRQSRHANLNTQRATNTTCAQCHEGRAALLRRFGEDANFAEKDAATGHIPPATCGVCHDPHGSGNPRQLRFPISSPDPEENLCVRCHLRIGFPEPAGTPTTVGTSETSPHAPQGALLLGFAGWRPPNFQDEEAGRIFGSHATDRNPRLCAGCHVAQFTVPDELRGGTIQATSHLMRPIPCLDAQGRPTADKNCAYTVQARSWQTCSSGNCHGSAQAAVNAFNDSRTLMKLLTDVLWVDSNGNGTLNPAPTDAGLLPTVRATRPQEWTSTGVTPAEGAEFNARLCGEYGQATSDNSKGVHNPFLCRALLISTAAFIRQHYNLPAASPEEQAVIDRVASSLSVSFQRSSTLPR